MIAVIGGGLAGITAALSSADHGSDVILFESKPKLGGLTHSFNRGDLHVDNGQHVFLRCCEAYRALLARLDVTDLVTLQPRLDIPVRVPGRERAGRLRRNRLPAPLHLGGALLRYAALTPLDRLRCARAVTALRALDPADPAVDDQNFGTWLRAHGQNDATITALWDLFVIATLNVPADQASLALSAKVFQTGLFDSAGAGDIGWSRVPLQQLHGDAAERALAAAGAAVRLGAKIDRIEQAEHGWVISERDGGRQHVDQVVLATPPEVTEALLPAGSVDLAAGWSNQLGSSPIVNVHVVLDRPVFDGPFVAGVGTEVQWVFDRTEQSGLASGQYLAISLSVADDTIGVSTAEIRARILPALHELLPGSSDAVVRDFFVTRERNATFRPGPGTGRFRPASTTNHPGLALAGAWTATGWPATMESAVLSGENAAASLRGQATRQEKGSVAA